MQELTYDEIVRHYRKELKEIQDELERMSRCIRKTDACFDEIWRGSNGELFREKLSKSGDELEQVMENIQFVMRQIGAYEQNL
jgi:hypothetical protein